MSMEFTFHSPIFLEETLSNKNKIISGTLLAEGVSRNRNYYSMAELDNISQSALGKPVFYGVDSFNKHKKGFAVGKIIKTIVDKVARKIKFWALIHDKDIAESVKKGWGISIGGIAKGGKWILNQLGKLVLKVFGVKINHVQLLSPDIIRGQDAAKVEKVVEESVSFTNMPEPDLTIINRTSFKVKAVIF
jgi:hypothetical protein